MDRASLPRGRTYWRTGLAGEARVVVIACSEVDLVEVGSEYVELVVLSCSGWWKDWRGKVIEVYSCSSKSSSIPRSNRLLEAIYSVSTADTVVVWNCNATVLGVMLGLLAKKFGARLVLVGDYPSTIARYADLVLSTSTSLSQLLSKLKR